MKRNLTLIFLCVFITLVSHSQSSNGFTASKSVNASCDSWLKATDRNDVVRIGDLDISGNQMTIEATFNRTEPLGIDLSGGDLVSKHNGSQDANYLLRANQAEITTTNGYFGAAANCGLELNKTFHAALVYNGTTLRFYRNGFLMKSVPATGNLILNNWSTTIGDYALSPSGSQENLSGYINEVRIWNVARTQQQIKDYMNTSIPSPATQPGLLAYYVFDGLENKQGNNTWDGVIDGNAVINQTNPTCANFVADSCGIIPPPPVTPLFNASDTVCVNSPVTITNTSINASSYYWSFCSASLANTVPLGTNLGNISGNLSQPVFMDYVKVGNNYYGFLMNHIPGGLIRLDFGNSLLNTPTSVNLGDFGGIIPTANGSEGIQLVNNEGKWYAIIVGGNVAEGTNPRILKIDFGADITNPNPIATNWGNLGNLDQPVDLHLFNENNEWYGFTVNAENNTITRFNFSSSFNNTPTATNLGGPGGIAYPTGIYVISDNGFWRAFVTNSGNNVPNSISSLTRLDFGNSLLNAPVGVNLGNPGNLLNSPRDITILQSCGEIFGFAVNGNPSANNIVRLNFNNDLSATPDIISLGNVGNFNFPHSISKLFRVNQDIYAFVTNVSNNTLTRLQFAGCTNASIPGFQGANPPTITYDQPGTYNINLTVDDGLPTQSSFCKQVVVLPNADFSFEQEICTPLTVNFFAAGNNITNPNWTFGDGNTNTTQVNPVNTYQANGNYDVTLSYTGACPSQKTVSVSITNNNIILTPDTVICEGTTALLRSQKSIGFCWSPTTYLDDPLIPNPTTSTPQNITYYLIAGIPGDNIITNFTPPVFNSGYADQKIWEQQVAVVPNTNYIFSVSTSALQTPNFTSLRFSINGQEMGPAINASLPTNEFFIRWNSGNSTTAYLSVINQNTYAAGTHFSIDDISFSSLMIYRDSVNIIVEKPFIQTNEDTLICSGMPVQLNTTGAASYVWTPATDLSDVNIANPVATPTNTIKYIVTGTTVNGCVAQDSLVISTKPYPIVTITNDTLICYKAPTQLQATGGDTYSWLPSAGLDNPFIPDPIATITQGRTYKVSVGLNECYTEDSVTITVRPYPVFNASTDQIICGAKEVQLNASGGGNYLWSPAAMLNDPTSAQPVTVPNRTTDYSVYISENTCGFDTTMNVKIEVTNEPALTAIPNAFTPNNDGKNDCFGIRRWGNAQIAQFAVYNRWGQIVFQTKDPSKCWDGTFNGRKQDAGGYVYVIKATTICGAIFKKGIVTLVR